MDTLDEWLAAVSAELEIPADSVDRDLLLGLAGEAAHAVVRPAAPLTTFLLGVAVGRGDPAGETAARIRSLAASWKEDHEISS